MTTSTDPPATPTAADSTVQSAVIVVNYASSQLIEHNLTALAGAPWRVIVVDNYSNESERQRVSDLVARLGWILVQMPTNAGFGAGVNAGARVALEQGCASLLLLNPDACVSPATVDALVRHSLCDPRALLSPLLVDGNGRTVFAGSLLDLRDGRVRRWPSGTETMERTNSLVPWLTAACLAFSVELWQRVGGFSEVYFMYWEDVDFGYRCLNAGAHVRLRTDLSATHEQGGTQGERLGRAKSPLYYYYNCRNRLIFGLRFLGRRRLLGWVVTTPRISWEVLMQGGRRQLVHSPKGGWATVKGASVGMALAISALCRAKAGKDSTDWPTS